MFVYVFGWNDQGPVKIGKADDTASREAELRVALPFPSFMMRQIGCGAGSHRIERDAHRRLAAVRLAGEWFYVTADEAEAAILSSAQDLGLPVEPHRPHPGDRLDRLRVVKDDRLHRNRLVEAATGQADRLAASVGAAKRRRWRVASREIKADAIGLAGKLGSISSAARALGLPVNTLTQWVSRARKSERARAAKSADLEELAGKVRQDAMPRARDAAHVVRIATGGVEEERARPCPAPAERWAPSPLFPPPRRQKPFLDSMLHGWAPNPNSPLDGRGFCP